jgi:hypothetical protein
MAEIRSKRRTPVQPSQVSRRKRKPRKKAGNRYTNCSSAHAVRRACERADRAARQVRENELAVNEVRPSTLVPKKVPAADRIIPPWAPNQLRHTFATDIRRDHGLEAAQVLLGHSRADVTQVYAERNRLLAERVAAVVG